MSKLHTISSIATILANYVLYIFTSTIVELELKYRTIERLAINKVQNT